MKNTNYTNHLRTQTMSNDRVGMAYVMLENYHQKGFNEGDIVRIIHDDGTDYPLVCKEDSFTTLLPLKRTQKVLHLKARYMEGVSKAGPMTYSEARQYKRDTFSTPEDKEPEPKLILQSAVFTDRFGNEYKVKRSPCRHYFLKVNDQDQVRTSVEEIRTAVESL